MAIRPHSCFLLPFTYLPAEATLPVSEDDSTSPQNLMPQYIWGERWWREWLWSKLQAFLEDTDYLDPGQSGFRSDFGTESAMVALVFVLNWERVTGCVTLLLLLGHSAAVDTISPWSHPGSSEWEGYLRNYTIVILFLSVSLSSESNTGGVLIKPPPQRERQKQASRQQKQLCVSRKVNPLMIYCPSPTIPKLESAMFGLPWWLQSVFYVLH